MDHGGHPAGIIVFLPILIAGLGYAVVGQRLGSAGSTVLARVLMLPVAVTLVGGRYFILRHVF